MIAVVDYGAGNLFSVRNSLTHLGIPHAITADPDAILSADGVILPGVGAFPDAMRMLHACDLVKTLQMAAARKPFLGICLGMQLLFEKGFEFAETEGLGLLPGQVERIPDTGLKIPHMGWNALRLHQPQCLLLKNVQPESYVYFVHSYRAVCPESVVAAFADYGAEIPALVWRGSTFGAQFHPEKSADVGLAMLRSFADLCEENAR